MKNVLHVLYNISLPIIILILLGWLFQKIFKIKVVSLSKLLIYLIVPIVILVKLYQAEITLILIAQIALFLLIMVVFQYLLSLIIGKARRYTKGMQNAFTNSLILFNSGNYGIPLIELTFNANPIAMASQVIIMLFQSIVTFTVGIFHASTGNASNKQALKNIFKMPTLYAIVFTFLLRFFKIAIPKTILISLNYITNAFIALALITLGIQLAEVKLGYRIKDVLIASIARVIIAPLIAFGIVFLLQVKGVLAQAMIIGASMPSAVNSALLAQEFNNEPEFATQMVFVTTILVTFTLPAIINFVQILL